MSELPFNISGRPFSAQQLNQKVKSDVQEEVEKYSLMKYPRTAGTVPSTAISKRPLSGICVANTHNGLKVTVNNTTFETDFKVRLFICL